MLTEYDIAAEIQANPGGTVVFTGAGMSTDSGLPDFRSKEGLWKNVDPMELATASAMRGDYERFHAFYSHRFEQMRDAAPNEGHKILADWEQRGFLSCIVTQNVDGLHAAAGSKKIYELHGAVGSVRCMECGSRATQEDFAAHKQCAFCGGRLRPGVVLFGEGLPANVPTSANSPQFPTARPFKRAPGCALTGAFHFGRV